MAEPTNRLGIVQGRILLDLKDLQSQRNIAIATAREMGEGFKRSFDQSSASSERLRERFAAMKIELDRLKSGQSQLVQSNNQANSSFDRLGGTVSGKLKSAFSSSISVIQTWQRQLDSAIARVKIFEREIAGLSLASNANAAFGLKIAENLRILQVRYTELTGSQERGLELMEQIAEAARSVGLPVRQTQQDFVNLIPAIEAVNGNIDEYLGLVTRLTVLNPAEGTAGAVRAISEALSSGGTDLVSVSERYNIAKRGLRIAIEEEGSFAAGLDRVLDDLGVTTKAAQEMSNGISGAMARIQDSVTQAFEKAFTPYLTTAANAVDGVATAIAGLDNTTAAWLGGLTLATAGATTFTLAMLQLYDIMQKIKKSGPVTQRLIGGGVALGVGTAIGIGATRAIGEATGNERLKNAGLGDLLETLRQAGFLIVNGLLEVGRDAAKGFAFIVGALSLVPAAIDKFRGQFEVAAGNMIAAFGQFIIDLANSLPVGGDEVRAIGQGVQSIGQNTITGGQARIDAAQRAIESVASGSFEATDAIDAMFDSFQQGNARLFGYITDEADMTAAKTQEKIQEAINNVLGIFATSRAQAQSIINDMHQQALDFFDFNVKLQTDLNRLARTGTPDEIRNRADALRDERQAIEALLPELEEVAATNEDAAESLAEYRTRLQEIAIETSRLAEVTGPAARRALQELNDGLEETIEKIEETSAEGIQKLSNKLAEDFAKLNEDIAEKTADLREDEREAIEDYQKKQAKNLKEHQKRLLELEQDSIRARVDAAARLDAAGVAAAILNQREKIADEDGRLKEQSEKEKERFDEVKEKLSKEAAAITDHYNKRYYELLKAAQQERFLLLQQKADQLRDAQNVYNQERGIIKSNQTAMLNDAKNAQAAQKTLMQQGYAAMTSATGFFAGSLVGYASQLANAANVAIAPKFVKTGSTPTSPKSFGAVQSPTPAPVGKLVKSFATGGVARIMNTPDREALAFVGNKERVLTPQQTTSFDKLVNMLGSGGGGGLGHFSFDVNVQGADRIEDFIHEISEVTTREVLNQVYERMAIGVRQ